MVSVDDDWSQRIVERETQALQQSTAQDEKRVT